MLLRFSTPKMKNSDLEGRKKRYAEAFEYAICNLLTLVTIAYPSWINVTITICQSIFQKRSKYGLYPSELINYE
jgi:hypothetical protein